MRVLSCLIAIISVCASLQAQSDTSEPLHIGSVTVSGMIHERFEEWDFFPSKGESVYGYSGSLLRLMLSQNEARYSWGVEVAAPILLGVPNHAVLPAPQGQLGLGGSYYAANHNQENAASAFIKQAYLCLKGGHSSIRFGRFEFIDGTEVTPKDEPLAIIKRDGIAQRLIGNFGFSDVQRSFDGVHYVYSDGSWNVTALSVIPDRGVFQVDGWGWVKTPVTYGAVTKQVSLSASRAEWRLFGIFYNDDRGILKTDNRAAAIRAKDLTGIDLITYGGHYIQAIPTPIGTFDLLGWGVLQNGRWGSLAQRSGAGTVQGGIQPPVLKAIRPWVRGGYFYSRGDNNAKDGVHGTFFVILPTPRVYARFPFFNEMNNREAFGELMLRPGKKLTLRSEVHGLWLANKNDLWYSGGGAFQPWTFGYSGRPSNGATGLATLYDTSADYRWTQRISTGLYFGYARKGAVVTHIFPGNDGAKFGFLEVNYGF